MERGLWLGEYHLLSLIGAGGMGEVWLAQRKGSSERVVVKRLLPHLSEDPGYVAMFLHEARIAALVTTPHTVAIKDCGAIDGSYYLVLEYVEGASLAQLIRGPLMGPALSAHIAAAICAGLAEIHRQRGPDGAELGIIHRDISPANVLIANDGAIKLTDFGIAKMSAVDAARVTTAGTVKGKLPYMAPEQFRAERIDQRTDVFAAGVVLYELLCGRLPYDAVTEAELLSQVMSGQRVPVTVRVPGLDPRLVDIVAAATETNRAARFESAAHMQRALESFTPPEARPALQAELARRVAAAPRPKLRPAPLPTAPGFVPVDHTVLAAEAYSPTDPTQPAAAPQLPPPPTRSPRAGVVVPLLTFALVLGAVGGWYSQRTAERPAPVQPEPKPNPEPNAVPVPVPEPGPGPEPEREPEREPGPIAAVGQPPPKSKPVKPAPKPAPRRLVTHPPCEVFSGARSLGVAPLDVPDGVTGRVRLVSRAQGIDYEAELAPVIDVPRATLQVRVFPWAKVSLDGKALGTTPIGVTQVYAGRHELVLENTEQGVSQRSELMISGGEEKIVRVRLP